MPERLMVRMALHTGTALEREQDYLGPALNRVARLLAAAHGGQILLSRATQELVREDLPDGASLRDLGSHRLKDLQQPEQLFQLLHPALPDAFAPVRSLEAFAHNLPIQVSSFVGREEEIVEVKRLLTTTRLLTLTGVGGCGKTRLALQVAADLLDRENDGAWFVDLAPFTDPALVPQAVAAVLGIREEPGRPLPQTLVEALLPKNLLLILDNCEHVLEACAALTEVLLRRCPGVQILATSRERLNLAGETTYRVPSLSLPPVEGVGRWALGVGNQGSSGSPNAQRLTPDALTQYEAVRLFIDRAIAVVPAFAVTNANAPAVAEICHRLDGIPLAIELAAVRVRVLSAEEIAARLDDRFPLLTGGSRASLPRQQTLGALIDWSYDLLAEPERTLLRRLSVFAGGWTLEAAEAVCSDFGFRVPSGRLDFGLGPTEQRHLRVLSDRLCRQSKIQNGEVLDLLTALVDKSLVVEEPGAETRYRLLETIREYGQERLEESGKAEELREQHARFFLALAEAAEPYLESAEQHEWRDRLEREQVNLRAALAWSLGVARDEGEGTRYEEEGPGDVEKPTPSHPSFLIPHPLEIGARLAGALCWFWANAGHWREGCQWVEAALARSEGLGRTPVRAKLLHAGGVMSGWFQKEAPRARARLEEAVALWRELGEARWLSDTLRQLAVMTSDQGDHNAARSVAEESVTLKRELGDQPGLVWSLYFLGNVAMAMGDFTAARAHYEESRAIAQGLGDRFALARPVGGLARVAGMQGDAAAARAFFEETVALRREQQDAHLGGWLEGLAAVVRNQGDLAAARSLYEEALTVWRKVSYQPGVAQSLAGLGTVVRSQGDREAARSYFEQSLAVIRQLKDRQRKQEARETIAECLEGLAVLAVLEAEEFQVHPEPQARSTGSGEARLDWAARLLGAASALRGAGDVPHRPNADAENDRPMDALRAALGDAAFAAAWAAGRRMPVEQILAEAAGGVDPDGRGSTWAGG